MKKLASLFLAVLFLTSLGISAGGQAPSGVGDRIEIGVQRSPGNWLDIQIENLKDAFDFFDKGDKLERRGVLRLS